MWASLWVKSLTISLKLSACIGERKDLMAQHEHGGTSNLHTIRQLQRENNEVHMYKDQVVGPGGVAWGTRGCGMGDQGVWHGGPGCVAWGTRVY